LEDSLRYATVRPGVKPRNEYIIMPTATKKPAKAHRGFAAMNPGLQQKLARLGGKASASKAKRGKNGRFQPRAKKRR
jgi:hypothetical protein